MRIGALLLFVLGLLVLSLLDGLAASLVAGILCAAGGLLVTSRQLAAIAVDEASAPPISIRVVRWNY